MKKKELKIKYANKKREGIDKNIIHENLPSHFFLGLIGKPGSGKTTILHNFLKNEDFYYQRFDRILIQSPSLIEFEMYDIPKTQLSEKLDVRKVLSFLNTVNYEKNILVIFDDMISDINLLQNDKDLNHLIFNRRHILDDGTVSVIITAQKYKMIPKKLRSNFSWLIFFPLNYADLKEIGEEVGYLDWKEKEKEIMNIWKKDPIYGFISFRLDKQTLTYKFDYFI